MRDTTQLHLNVVVSDEKGTNELALDSWAELEPLVERYLEKYAQDLESVHTAEPLAQSERSAIKSFLAWLTGPGHRKWKASPRDERLRDYLDTVLVRVGDKKALVGS
jgi:hypothetical protein